MITCYKYNQKGHWTRRCVGKSTTRWNNRRIPQIQGEDTTRCSQRGSNSIQLLHEVKVERSCKSKDQLSGFISLQEMANLRICKIKSCCHEFCHKPLARNDKICFQKNRIWNLVPFSTKLLFKTSEVYQELECEMHQTKYKEMIGCNMD
jgi:hypothetical protein